MSDQIFTGDVPRHYDAGLGPVIFQDYANDIAARTAVLAPSDVLEVAAGTGIVSRRLRDVLPSTTQLVATDLSAPMLEIARAKFAPGEAIEILPADALALPFGEDAFDAVVCQFGAMFFPDKTKAFSEAARVLRPGGRFLFSCWGSPAENPRVAVTEAVFARLCGRNHNASALIPYSYCDPAQVMADLRTAGWVDVVFERLAIRVAVRDLEGFARGIVFGSVRVLDVLKSGADPEALVVELMEEFQQVLGPGDLHMGTVAYLYECRKA